MIYDRARKCFMRSVFINCGAITVNEVNGSLNCGAITVNEVNGSLNRGAITVNEVNGSHFPWLYQNFVIS